MLFFKQRKQAHFIAWEGTKTGKKTQQSKTKTGKKTQQSKIKTKSDNLWWFNIFIRILTVELMIFAVLRICVLQTHNKKKRNKKKREREK